MKRVLRICLGVGLLAIVIASGTHGDPAAAGARRSQTETSTATAYFFGPGPANVGLAAFDQDLRITASRTTTTDASGSHAESQWFDIFTVYDRTTGAPLLSCSASGPLEAAAFTASTDLQLAVLDASAGTMTPTGDSATGFNDAAICPGLSLRVVMTWRAVSTAQVDRKDDHGNACKRESPDITVEASATGITLTSPASESPSAIQQGPSVSGSISRTVEC